MSKEFDMTFQDRDEAIFGMPKLLVPKERLEDRLDYLKEYKNAQFGEEWEFDKSNNHHSVRNTKD